MRKKIIGKREATLPSGSLREGLDIAAIATVHLTSESPEFPIENVFDEQTGPGGTRWTASEPGEQTLILQFDAPQTFHEVLLEAEELEVDRTQVVELFLSIDGQRVTGRFRRIQLPSPGTTSSGKSGQCRPRVSPV